MVDRNKDLEILMEVEEKIKIWESSMSLFIQQYQNDADYWRLIRDKPNNLRALSNPPV